ncbi:MAG UNVERIFIED_CONTAM: hypothetical protein LVQ98_07585 [Rickettsiaceae bacterium]|jgi:hypothetical protein
MNTGAIPLDVIKGLPDRLLKLLTAIIEHTPELKGTTVAQALTEMVVSRKTRSSSTNCI